MFHALHHHYGRAVTADRRRLAARRRLVAAAVTAGVVAGCGAQTGVAPTAAKQSVERAAHVKLAAEPVPGEAREQGLRASFSNARTVAKDQQAVALFVLEDASVADEVGDQIRASAPQTAEFIVHDEVMVVYADAGADRGAAVTKAVKGL